MISCGTAMHHNPAAFAAVTPCGESSIAIAPGGRDAERRARREVGVGRGLPASPSPKHAMYAKRCEQPEAFEMRLDPVERRARRDRQREPERIGLVEPLAHAGSGRLAREQLVAPDPPALVHRVLVERVVARVRISSTRSRPPGRPDLGGPLLDRQRRAAVRLELLLPGGEHRALGVEDQPVEVEHHRPDLPRRIRPVCGHEGGRSARPGLRRGRPPSPSARFRSARGPRSGGAPRRGRGRGSATERPRRRRRNTRGGRNPGARPAHPAPIPRP